MPLIIPTPQLPAGLSSFRTTSSGLFVPQRALERPGTSKLAIATGDITKALNATTVGNAAREAFAQLSANHGAPVADIMMGSQRALLARVAADERHDRIISEFLRGRIVVDSTR